MTTWADREGRILDLIVAMDRADQPRPSRDSLVADLGLDRETVVRGIQLLLDDDLIRGTDMGTLDGPDWIEIRPTANGLRASETSQAALFPINQGGPEETAGFILGDSRLGIDSVLGGGSAPTPTGAATGSTVPNGSAAADIPTPTAQAFGTDPNAAAVAAREGARRRGGEPFRLQGTPAFAAGAPAFPPGAPAFRPGVPFTGISNIEPESVPDDSNLAALVAARDLLSDVIDDADEGEPPPLRPASTGAVTTGDRGLPTREFMTDTAWVVANESTRNVEARIEDVRRILHRLGNDSHHDATAQEAFRAAEGNLALALRFLVRDEIHAPATKQWLASVHAALVDTLRVVGPLIDPNAAATIQFAAVVFDRLAKRKRPD